MRVVVVLPLGEDLAGVGRRAEQGLVQKFIPQTPVEAFDERVLRRFSRRDVVPFDTAILGPLQHRHAGELGAVVADDAGRQAANHGDGVEFAGNPLARERGVRHKGQALPREVVDDG